MWTTAGRKARNHSCTITRRRNTRGWQETILPRWQIWPETVWPDRSEKLSWSEGVKYLSWTPKLNGMSRHSTEYRMKFTGAKKTKLEWVWHNPNKLPGTQHVQGVYIGFSWVWQKTWVEIITQLLQLLCVTDLRPHFRPQMNLWPHFQLVISFKYACLCLLIISIEKSGSWNWSTRNTIFQKSFS